MKSERDQKSHISTPHGRKKKFTVSRNYANSCIVGRLHRIEPCYKGFSLDPARRHIQRRKEDIIIPRYRATKMEAQVSDCREEVGK